MAIDSNNQIKRPYSCKRLVVCCDGTWQASNHGTRSVPSNIAKISRSIKPYGPDKDGVLCPQITYYDAGVGTGMGWLDQRYSGNSSISILIQGGAMFDNLCRSIRRRPIGERLRGIQFPSEQLRKRRRSLHIWIFKRRVHSQIVLYRNSTKLLNFVPDAPLVSQAC